MGFGNRLVIWLSGCPFSCKGCIEEPLQSGKLGKDIQINVINDIIINNLSTIDGITFSGGEPLAQSVELLELLEFLPKKLDKMLFTGYKFEELSSIEKETYEKFDLVVDGRFEINKVGNFLWRGSSNQRFTSPTLKYKPIIKDLELAPSLGLTVKVIDENLYFYGIPTKKDEISILKQKLEKNILMEN